MCLFSSVYTYDASGNRATMVSKVNEHIYATTTYSYNLANMVVSMTNDPSNESAQTFTYTYYLDGNQRTKTEGTKVTTYAYDYAGRLVSEVTTDNGVPSVGYTYTYDDFGNRLTMTTDGVTTSYTYDLNNRLLQTTAGETTVTYTYNANGDMITEYKVVENIPEQNTTYTYSIYTGMLSSVSSTVGNVNASYDYNASGLRMKNGDTYFIYDGQNIVAEYDLAEDEYIAVYGYGINRISRFTDGTTGEIYLFNAHGDVVGLVAISGENVGKIIKEYDYDAFGNEAFPDPDDENPFRYCGEYYDKGTNRLYLRARDYDASTGRFTSEDTHWNAKNTIYGDNPLKIGDKLVPNQTAFMQSLNRYTYCTSNPIMYVDYTGFAVTEWDIEHLTEKEIEILKRNTEIWNEANAHDDIETMEAMHVLSEAIRNKYRDDNEIGDGSGRTVLKESNNSNNSNSNNSIEIVEIIVFAIIFPFIVLSGCGPKDQLPMGPLPPNWNSQWYSGYGTRGGYHWFDPDGGEWRYHAPDKYHSEAHWDYNPWEDWNSKWQNIYPQ